MDKKPRILIVDHKRENQETLETLLKKPDAEIIKANSADEALKKITHHDFALALINTELPEMDGYSLAERLRKKEKTARLPVIFISASGDNLAVFNGYEKGAFSVITIPFQPEQLINKVNFFIEKQQQEIALYNLTRDLEKKNREIESISKELESFSYSVSHDLRAPLRALSGYSKILEEDYAGMFDGEAKRLLENIHYNGQKMTQLIDNLLEFSRLGRKEVQVSNLNMEELVEGVMHEINQSSRHRASVSINSLHEAGGDYSLLCQVWKNLISNAIKYSSKKERPEVIIGSGRSENEITYFIKDNGAGFDMRYAHKLFGVFQRLHHPDEFDGTGIGLAIIQRVIAKHGGRVWAEARVNEGATFYFTLPITF